MSVSITGYRKLFFVVIALLMSACAATVSPPELPDPAMDWSQTAELPADIRAGLKGSSVEQVPTGKGVNVPVRLFGAEGLYQCHGRSERGSFNVVQYLFHVLFLFSARLSRANIHLSPLPKQAPCQRSDMGKSGRFFRFCENVYGKNV